MSDSLWPHVLQHSRLPCPSLSPGGFSNSCPLNRWYYPIISSSVIPFFCLQFFLVSGCFPMSLLFISGGQNIGVSASASVLPMIIQGWFPSGLTGLNSLQSKGLSSLLQHYSLKGSLLYGPALTSIMTTGKTEALTRWTLSQSEVSGF